MYFITHLINIHIGTQSKCLLSCKAWQSLQGAGRECRYSGAKRGIGDIRGHWGLLGGVGGIGAIGGIREYRGVKDAFGVASGLGSQPHWAPVQGPNTPTGSPWGVTYLTKARQGPLLRVLSLPLVSLGEWPTWPRPSKWQKWALHTIIYIWN